MKMLRLRLHVTAAYVQDSCVTLFLLCRQGSFVLMCASYS